MICSLCISIPSCSPGFKCYLHMLFRAADIVPVSYTHLDVYKRQHLNWWKDYWLKSYINVADTTLQRYYFGALYGLGCTVRATPEGAEQPNVPASMLGVWQTNDTCASAGKGYTNYNYESPSVSYTHLIHRTKGKTEIPVTLKCRPCP